MLYLGEFVEAQGFLNKGAAAAAAEGDIITHSHVGSVGLVGSEVNRCDRPRRRLARVFIQLDRPAARKSSPVLCNRLGYYGRYPRCGVSLCTQKDFLNLTGKPSDNIYYYDTYAIAEGVALFGTFCTILPGKEIICHKHSPLTTLPPRRLVIRRRGLHSST